MTRNKERGLAAEYHVIDKLQGRGLEVNYIDAWYDLEVEGHKLEVKSACLSVKSSGAKKGLSSWEFGRFDFTKEENRTKIWNNNLWLCFVIRWRSEFLILGFIKANKLPCKRYHKISQLRDKRLLDINNFVDEIKKNP